MHIAVYVAAQVSWHNKVSSVDEIISSGTDQVDGRALYRKIITKETIKKIEFFRYRIFIVSLCQTFSFVQFLVLLH